MENNLVRTEELLGSKKNVIGSANADIILETLGKVYIKTGKQTRVLNDVFKLLDGINGSNAGSKTIITKNLASLKYPGDGYLVFDSKENALYISYDQRYLLIIDGIDKEIKDLGFVKKEGDSMYGPLQIYHSGAPLIVASSELVKRFNANFLEGHDSTYFAAKSLDEFISGYWTFLDNVLAEKNVQINEQLTVNQNSIVKGNSEVGVNLLVKGGAEVLDVSQFRNNVSVDGDIILDGSIGSPMFMSGYLGYGWRFDANTNMLTVDYLVVRKAMHVFELVVNKISATNGSLWVTDSAKIEEVYDVKTLPLNTTTDEDGVSYTKYSSVELNVWYVPYEIDYNRVKLAINDANIKRPELYTHLPNGKINLTDNYYDIFKCLCKYKPLHDWVDLDLGNFDNIDKIATLFPESECGIGELTHFLRDEGFGFPLDGEIPIYIHDANQSFREPIVYNYCDDKGNSLPDNYNEEYAYIRLIMCVEADALDLANIENLYRYNNITKKYIKYNSDVLEYERYKYKYIQKTCSVKVLYSSKLTPLEKATHFKYIKDNKEYFLEAKPTHIQNTNQRYTWNAELLEYVINDYGELYFDGTEYVEFADFIKAEPATHYYDSGTKEYKESTYYDEDEEIYIYSGIKPEYYFNYVTNSWEKGATHIYNDATDEYVLVGEATHLLSNFRLAEGLPGATHVFVPESYFAVASNVYVPTHARNEKITEDDPEFITREESVMMDPQISTNRILNPVTTPKIITVDKQLELVTTDDIKCLDAFYKYFGIVANDDIWDGTSIVKLDNVKVIKMKEDEYPPFKEGDILRCLKFENGNIKFYEAIVVCKIDTYSYVIIVAGSVFDIQTTVEYNDDGTVKEYKEELNKSQYSKTSQLESDYGESAVDKDGFDENSLIAGPAPEDGLVRIGHLFDRDRLNSVYITSSEMNSPYIQTISGVNRPDYTVLYGEPDFITNNRGYYQFSVEHFDIISGDADEGMVSVNTPNGTAKFECKRSKFFAPNNHYINSANEVVLADYNVDKVKVNTNARVRLGNLDGITDPLFKDKQPYGYGLFADNVFLKGEFHLSNGKSVVLFGDDIKMEVTDKVNGVNKELSLFKQTSKELSMKVLGFNPMFEVPSLALAKLNGYKIEKADSASDIPNTAVYVKGSVYKLKSGVAISNSQVYWDKDLPVNGGEYENKPFYRTWAGNYAVFYLNFIPRVDIVKDKPLEITISKITNAECVMVIKNSKNEVVSDEKTLPNIDLLQNYKITFNLNQVLKANETYRLCVSDMWATNIYYPITTNYDVESNAYMNILNDRIETGINDVLGNEFKSIQTAVGELTTYKNESTEQFAEFKQGLEEFKSTIGTQGEQISEISQKADEIALKVLDLSIAVFETPSLEKALRDYSEYLERDSETGVVVLPIARYKTSLGNYIGYGAGNKIYWSDANTKTNSYIVGYSLIPLKYGATFIIRAPNAVHDGEGSLSHVKIESTSYYLTYDTTNKYYYFNIEEKPSTAKSDIKYEANTLLTLWGDRGVIFPITTNYDAPIGSAISATKDSISLTINGVEDNIDGITEGLTKTGINIDTNQITLNADNTTIKGSLIVNQNATGEFGIRVSTGDNQTPLNITGNTEKESFIDVMIPLHDKYPSAIGYDANDKLLSGTTKSGNELIGTVDYSNSVTFKTGKYDSKMGVIQGGLAIRLSKGGDASILKNIKAAIRVNLGYTNSKGSGTQTFELPLRLSEVNGGTAFYYSKLEDCKKQVLYLESEYKMQSVLFVFTIPLGTTFTNGFKKDTYFDEYTTFFKVINKPSSKYKTGNLYVLNNFEQEYNFYGPNSQDYTNAEIRNQYLLFDQDKFVVNMVNSGIKCEGNLVLLKATPKSGNDVWVPLNNSHVTFQTDNTLETLDDLVGDMILLGFTKLVVLEVKNNANIPIGRSYKIFQNDCIYNKVTIRLPYDASVRYKIALEFSKVYENNDESPWDYKITQENIGYITLIKVDEYNWFICANL